MAVITETLAQRNFELIRDRIAEILADELANQATLNADPEINATVYLERLVPMTQEELPVVNVFTAEGDYNRFTDLSQTGEYKFAIDCYHRGFTEGSGGDERGDTISTKRMMRLVGLIQAILSHWRYCKLGFAANFIDRVEIQDFKLMEPVKAQDASNVSKGRLIFMVKAEETIEPASAELVEGFDTQVFLGETAFGFVYSGTPPVIPPPTCPPGDAKDSAGTNVAVVPSGGFALIPDSLLTLNGAAFLSLLSTQGEDIVLQDQNDDPIVPDSVVDNVITVTIPTIRDTAKLMKTGQTTSYRTGDDGDLEEGRNANFTTLDSNNPHGNLNRFTDELGGQTYTNDIVIDWSTYDGVEALGWYKGATPIEAWNLSIDNALALTVAGFANWRIPNLHELLSVSDMSLINTLDYSPFNLTLSVTWTSTTYRNSTTSAWQVSNQGGVTFVTKAVGRFSFRCMNFTNADLGI